MTTHNPTLIQFLAQLRGHLLVVATEIAPVTGIIPDPAAIAASPAYGEWLAILNQEGDPKHLEGLCEKWGRILFAPYRTTTYEVPTWFEETAVGEAWHKCRMESVKAQGIRLLSPTEVEKQFGFNRQTLEHYIQRGRVRIYHDISAPERQFRRLMREDEVRRLNRQRVHRAQERKAKRTTRKRESVANPQRITRERSKGWKSPRPSRYVGRGSKYGNPYTVELYGREKAVEMYKTFALATIGIEQIQHDLKGQHLLCWCKQDEACHADWLLEVANREEAGE
jgi:hypothetical protein